MRAIRRQSWLFAAVLVVGGCLCTGIAPLAPDGAIDDDGGDAAIADAGDAGDSGVDAGFDAGSRWMAAIAMAGAASNACAAQVNASTR